MSAEAIGGAVTAKVWTMDVGSPAVCEILLAKANKQESGGKDEL